MSSAPQDHPDPVVGSRDKSVPWYSEQLESVNPDARNLLEKYSGIPPDQIVPHIYKVREKAWNVFPYPCIGVFRFLDLTIGEHPLYSEIVSRLKPPSNQTYLDLGCCFGQDIRRLVADGVPSENCYGCDLRLDFIELGYDLFLDRNKLNSKFMAADVFDEDSDLKQLDGKVDILHTAAFFHLFGYEDQKKVARRVVKLLKPQKDSLLVGKQVGADKGGEHPHRTNPSRSMYRHNPETWKRMWEEIGEETGTRWEVQAELLEWTGTDKPQNQGWSPDGVKRLVFSVRRL